MKKIGNYWFPDRENHHLYIDEILKKNYYRPEHLDYAFKFVKKWDIAVDVGANIGTLSIYMAKKFKKVYSFELVHENFECLRKNIDDHGYNNIIPFCFGLGKENKKVDIIYDSVYPDSLAGVCANVNKEGIYELKTLDSLNLEGCDFLKIDVEGLESHVLEGGFNTISKYKPVIILEYKQRKSVQAGTNLRDIDEMIKKLNYKKVGGYNSDLVFVCS